MYMVKVLPLKKTWKKSAISGPQLRIISAISLRRVTAINNCNINNICQISLSAKCFPKFRLFEVLTKTSPIGYSQQYSSDPAGSSSRGQGAVYRFKFSERLNAS